MQDNIITTGLSIAVPLFAGLNIFQFLFYKTTKRKAEAEADAAAVDTMKKKQELNSATYEDLNNQVQAMMSQLMQMQSELTAAFRQVAVLSGKLAAETGKNERLTAEMERVICERDMYKARCHDLENQLKNMSK